MEWAVIVALVLGIPVILFPAAYVWYMNIGGMYATLREKRKTAEMAGERAATR